MYTLPDADLYRDVQKNLAGLSEQQLTTQERQALEARLRQLRGEPFLLRIVRWFGRRLSGPGREIGARSAESVEKPLLRQGS
jgi:hypothetical protein